MAMDNLNGRTVNSVIDFDLIVNTDIGLIRFIRENYKDPRAFRLDILEKSDREILSLLSSRENINPLSVISTEENMHDIDGLYTDDPRQNPNATFIEEVDDVESVMGMGKKSTGSKVGTGGMNTKLTAAKIATKSGVDMVIANSADISVISKITDGEVIGTHFIAHKDDLFDLPDFVNNIHKA